MTRLYEAMEAKEQEIYDEMEDLDVSGEEYMELAEQLKELHALMNEEWARIEAAALSV